MNKLSAFFKKLSASFLNLLFPENLTCVNCGAELLADTRCNFCAECMEKLPFIGKHRCTICGCELINEADYCNNCQKFDHFFERNVAPLKYEGVAAELIKKLKFGNKRYIASELAKLMTDEFILSGAAADIAVFVPMSAKEEKARGFNQSRLIAENVAARLNIPLSEELKKVRETDTQKKLTAAERRENLKSVFALFNKSGLKGKTVLLIDDVFTTGATVNECARVLKKAGVRKVYSLTACITQFKLNAETSQEK